MDILSGYPLVALTWPGPGGKHNHEGLGRGGPPPPHQTLEIGKLWKLKWYQAKGLNKMILKNPSFYIRPISKVKGQGHGTKFVFLNDLDLNIPEESGMHKNRQTWLEMRENICHWGILCYANRPMSRSRHC